MTLETVVLSFIYAECRKKPSVLSVIMLTVVMLNVVAPLRQSPFTPRAPRTQESGIVFYSLHFYNL
jgi:hypothetical protein